MLYLLTIICGLCAVGIFFPLMLRESRLRRLDAIRMIHTDFVGHNCNLPPYPIASTELTIGRLKRRCDICLLDVIKAKMGSDSTNPNEPAPKSTVSQVHARLWWDGISFRIAPIYTLHADGTRSKPKVWVNMIPVVKETGMEVGYNDVITISDDQFKFKLVDTSSRYPSTRNSPKHSAKTHVFRHPSGRGRRSASRSHKRKSPLITAAAVLTVLVLIVALASFGISRAVVMPEAENALGERKDDTATFLLCGVDQQGVRTDTMMLVYISGSENKIGLLSLPRDTITINESGRTVKLNAIYTGRGTEGAEDLMQCVSQYIGYTPDGYLIFNWKLVEDITDLMGGLDLVLKQQISVETDGVEVHVPEGEQHLNGEEVLAALRYRYGYVDADLGRVKVQRQIVEAVTEQWVSLDKISLVPDALELLQEHSVTNLSTSNLLWLAKTVLTSRGEMATATLDGYPEYRNGISYYFLNPRGIVDQINSDFNPYLVDITNEDLSVVK